MTGSRPDPSSRAHFERVYQADPDPWHFAASPYEQARYAALLTHVPPGRYRRAFEPGCSVGVLTVELARRCGHVLAVDIAATALERARERCRDLPNVELRQAALTAVDLGSTPFDLIVFSEIGYYSDREHLLPVLTRLREQVLPGGRLIGQHWIGHSPDHTRHGFEVHADLEQVLRSWDHPVHQVTTDPEHQGYVLDVWNRPPASHPADPPADPPAGPPAGPR